MSVNKSFGLMAIFVVAMIAAGFALNHGRFPFSPMLSRTADLEDRVTALEADVAAMREVRP